MFLYKNIKMGNIRTIKILGVTIYMHEKTAEYVKQSFICGVVSTSTIGKNNIWDKTIKILGQPLIKRTDELFFRKIYIMDFLIRKNDLRYLFKNRYSRFINKKHDDIYILNANSGEAYLFLALFNTYMLKNGSKMPLIIAQKRYHIDLIKMLCPQVPYIFIPSLKNLIPCEMFQAGHQRFFILFPPSHYYNLENDIQNNPHKSIHYFSRILEALNIKEQGTIVQKPIISKNAKFKMLKKIKKIGLNLNKFIFISPVAKSNPSLSNNFWIKLSDEIKRSGYDLFFNTMPVGINTKNIKTCFLTFEEAYALAEFSQGIIALRSGFIELLSTIDKTPILCLYTPFKKRGSLEAMPAETVLKSFTLKLLPNINSNNINEYDMSQISEAALLDEIIKSLNIPPKRIGVN